jgi:tRNA A-37 threonylcarbamoyl transferase component Bud32
MTPEQHARAKQLFVAVADRPASDREAFFEQHAAEDATVLDEVRSLLKHHSSNTLLGHSDQTQPPPPSAPLSQLAVPAGASLAARGTWLKLGPQGFLALGTVLTCLALIAVNYLASWAMESTLRRLRASTLSSGLDITVQAIELWIDQEKTRVEVVARDPELRRNAQQLAQRLAASPQPSQGVDSPDQIAIHKQLVADFGAQVKYAIWDRQMITLADWSGDRSIIGKGVSEYGAALLTRVFDGETVIDLPTDQQTITKDYPIDPATRDITLTTPIRDERGDVMAALLVYGIGAYDRFNEMLALVQYGQTGETYAFDRTGRMLSKSRFAAKLADWGLVDASERANPRRLYLRDPGGDLTQGFRPSAPRDTWPLTKMARFATAQQNDVDLDGYRDYRGVMVVGAWQWLPAYGIGVTTEIDIAELNSAFRYLKLESAFKFGLLAVALGMAVLSYSSLARIRSRIGATAVVGQYTLEEKIGEGGMGVVYKARHALLKRPVALKLLKDSVANRRTTAWFEREVQLASQLTHPNTIAIYDYGVTPEGMFYYVMEYLQGDNLEQAVQRDGPQPWQRVVRILRQAGGSLHEAHQLGLVHRDIKPHNIMLCQRGGESGVVKVLDFGLAKQLRGDASSAPTVLAGTPLYMAPERFTSPQQSDWRADLYALGAVGFFLLTGREIFPASDPPGLLHHVLNTVPPRVSDCVDTPVPAALADLIADCLSKDPNDRPRDMAAVLAVLDQLESTVRRLP